MSTDMTGILTLEQLLALLEVETVTREVEVPGWPGRVVIKQFSLDVQRTIRQQARGEDDEVDQTMLDALTLHHGLVQPAITLEQARALTCKASLGAVQTILNAIHELSGLTALLEVSQKAVADTERRFRRRRG